MNTTGKKWIVRLGLPAMVAAGAMVVTAGPAQAGQWVSGGVYVQQSQCRSVGEARVKSGYYERYTCTAQNPGWWLQGFVN
ncbi:hypothetical protein C1I95_07775 [Micromonospora craterilacus]|uniref:Uncharacterized protein n=1 Tax=Micromonospora craterilacus TaxID=1655439 RepID=A0A2W2EAZ6_9ACTN|nr:hypothetical protein [Micromonospora craterilacus]PZG21322.1 hypothetical protein C1I95_07775 [Micromonospora craterilacus]